MSRLVSLLSPVGVVLVTLATLTAFAPAAPAQTDAQVYVIHGIPGQDLGLDPALPVDITVNGGCALTNVVFKDVAGPLPFAPGNYTIEIRPADLVNPCSQPPIITANVDFAAGENATVIAHLTDTGGASASKFVNDLSPTAEFIKTRVIAQHAANAPLVDLQLRRRYFVLRQTVQDVPNGAQANINMAAGIWDFALTPAGSKTIAFGPEVLWLYPETAYLTYVVGSLATGTLTLIVQPVDVGTLG